jgi:hypothetical protein
MPPGGWCVTGESLQVEHDERSAIVFGEQSFEIDSARVNRHDTAPVIKK